MRWIGCVLILFILQSCEKEPLEIGFRIKMEGFNLKVDPNFPAPDSVWIPYKHSRGLITFERGEEIYYYVFKEDQLEDNLAEIPVGEYLMELYVHDASLYGQSAASFTAAPRMVSITEQTDTITIEVEVNCSMILVCDENANLEQGASIIERNSGAGYVAYPMEKDISTGMYYSYFTPDPDSEDPSAFIWFYGYGSEEVMGGMSTSDFKRGCRYFINVLE